MSFRLTFELLCKVCEQEITRKKQGDTAACVALFGAARYAVCPCCRQEVKEHDDEEYRSRADAFVRRPRIYAGVGHSRFDR